MCSTAIGGFGPLKPASARVGRGHGVYGLHLRINVRPACSLLHLFTSLSVKGMLEFTTYGSPRPISSGAVRYQDNLPETRAHTIALIMRSKLL